MTRTHSRHVVFSSADIKAAIIFWLMSNGQAYPDGSHTSEGFSLNENEAVLIWQTKDEMEVAI